MTHWSDDYAQGWKSRERYKLYYYLENKEDWTLYDTSRILEEITEVAIARSSESSSVYKIMLGDEFVALYHLGKEVVEPE